MRSEIIRRRRVWLGALVFLVVAGTTAAVVVWLTGGTTERATAEGECHLAGWVSGQGTITGTGAVPCDEPVTLTATAKAGWCFSFWPGDEPALGCPRSSSKVVTVTAAEGSILWSAVFVEAPDSCAGVAVQRADEQPELLADCELQLSFRDELAGDAALNWSTSLELTSWDGVLTAGAPTRVRKLELSNQNLSGALPQRLVNLEGLTELRLDGNSLSGRIPPELGLLRHLTHLYVSGNAFSGCYPPAWGEVANHDLDQLSIPSCAIAYDLHSSSGATTAGSYAFIFDAADLQSTRSDWMNVRNGFLLLNETDAEGRDQAAFYDTIQAGDVVDWSLGVACYRRHTVTEVMADPAGAPARRLFRVKYRDLDWTGCDSNSITQATDAVHFVWHPPAWEWGADGIRELGFEPVTGPGRYRLGGSHVIIQIPDGMTVHITEVEFAEATAWIGLIDVATGASMGFNAETGDIASRHGTDLLSPAEQARVNAQFDQIAASLQTSETMR